MTDLSSLWFKLDETRYSFVLDNSFQDTHHGKTFVVAIQKIIKMEVALNTHICTLVIFIEDYKCLF